MLEGITASLAAAFDTVFAPILLMNPIISLFVMSIILTVIVVALNAAVINRRLIKELKDSMEEIRENLTRAQKENNAEEVKKFLSELMNLNSKYMKSMYKTLIVSMIVIVLFFPWLGTKFQEFTLVLPFTGRALESFQIPILGMDVKAWILWYVLVSFTIGWMVRKLLGFD